MLRNRDHRSHRGAVFGQPLYIPSHAGGRAGDASSAYGKYEKFVTDQLYRTQHIPQFLFRRYTIVGRRICPTLHI